MRKIIAALNLTIDGFCDHTAGVPDEEVHNHYTELLNSSGVILYGRTTYELMLFWRTLIETPSDKKSMNDFAAAIDKIPKIVFSHTFKTSDINWPSARLASKSPEAMVAELRQQPGGDILVGSRSLIVELANLNLIDEYQLCIHPVIIGKGLPLFDNIKEGRVFNLVNTKTFKTSGAQLNYYTPKMQ